ncbi:MAG TPA: AcvB/VirJ family lysyl-phosphatidylglycerol hydrolase [Candidatus Polarisedimenticolia bacterium]
MMDRKALRLAASLLLSCGAGSLAAADSPVSVKVATSRGEFKLMVFHPPADTPPGKPGILFISGEGGWRRFDDLIASDLAGLGHWVGGVDAMEYFWQPQDDRQALAVDFRAYAAALARAAKGPEDTPVVLGGFSFGADLAPLLAGSGGWGERLGGLLMIGPDETGSLAFRLMEILGFESKDHVFSVAEALRAASGTPVAFIHGEKDGSSATPSLHERATGPKKLIVVAGADHHFSGREDRLRAALGESMEWLAGKPAHEHQ